MEFGSHAGLWRRTKTKFHLEVNWNKPKFTSIPTVKAFKKSKPALKGRLVVKEKWPEPKNNYAVRFLRSVRSVLRPNGSRRSMPAM